MRLFRCRKLSATFMSTPQDDFRELRISFTFQDMLQIPNSSLAISHCEPCLRWPDFLFEFSENLGATAHSDKHKRTRPSRCILLLWLMKRLQCKIDLLTVCCGVKISHKRNNHSSWVSLFKETHCNYKYITNLSRRVIWNHFVFVYEKNSSCTTKSAIIG